VLLLYASYVYGNKSEQVTVHVLARFVEAKPS